MPFLSLIIAVFVFYACSHPGILSNNGVESLPTPYIDIANRTPEQDRANRPQTTYEACLPPLITFGFPNGETFLLPPEQEPLLPSGKWKYVSTLPQSAESTEYTLAFVHSRNTHNEVWVVTNNPKILYQYRTDTQKWTINKTADVSTASYLFLDGKGDVWSDNL